MAHFKKEELEIILEEGEKNVLTWKGKSRFREPTAVIDPFYEEIMSSLDGKELEVDVSCLEYMNSSTILSIISLVKKLNSRAIKTLVVYDSSLEWQQASFRALQNISRMLEHIEVTGR